MALILPSIPRLPKPGTKIASTSLSSLNCFVLNLLSHIFYIDARISMDTRMIKLHLKIYNNL